MGDVPYICTKAVASRNTLIFVDGTNDFDWLFDEGEFKKCIDICVLRIYRKRNM